MAGKLDWSFDAALLADTSGYLWFRSVAEIEQRPAYVPGITVEKGDLAQLVGGYRFGPDQEIRCGLNGCNQPHQKGYLISTKSGQETVCGNVCGHNHLGVDFDEMEAKFAATVVQATKQQTIAGLKEQAAEWLERTSHLEAELAKVYGPLQKIRQQFRQERTADRLLITLMRDGGTIKRQRALTKRERDLIGNPAVRFTSEKVGTVRGVSVLNDYARIANILSNDLRATIEEVQKLDDIAAVKGQQLTAFATAIQRMPNAAKEVADFIAVARDFLSPDNFLAFSRIDQMDQSSAAKLAPVFRTISVHFGVQAAQ